MERTNQECNLDRSNDKSNSQDYKLEEIASERITEEIEDDHTSLKKKFNQTPLVFYCKLGNSYLFSFKKDEGKYCFKAVLSFIFKFLSLLIFQGFVLCFIWIITRVSRDTKIILTCLTAFQMLMFLLIFIIDAGTLLEDE